jgi:hypothetical protein
MPPTLYELRFYQRERPLRTAAAIVTALDLDSPTLFDDLLKRHVLGAAARAGIARDEAHTLHVEVRPVDRNGRPVRDALLSWALPAPPEPV